MATAEWFPIIHPAVRRIPWAMLVPHEARVRKNHHADLNYLAEHQGLFPAEVLDILDGLHLSRRFLLSPDENALELLRRVAAWESRGTLPGPESEVDHGVG